MQCSISLVESLSSNNYYLMTNADGNEVYDDDGNLLLYQAEGGNCVSVPNTEEVRRLYDLPTNPPEKRDTVKKEEVCKPGSLKRVQSDANQIVWVGQKKQHSMNATKKLIELFDSPKYQTLMKDPNTVKLKVWEKIAGELEANGFKIAATIREAGLRTFQKWRNMERTYWKIRKMNSEECGEDKRKKKPHFYDDMHAVMSKRNKELQFEHLYTNEVVNDKEEEFENDDDDINYQIPEGELKRRRISDLYGTECEAFPRQALGLLTSLVTSPKYEESVRENANKFSKSKVWESIYIDMMKEGWEFGSNVKEGALILSEKWRMIEKTILRKKLCGPRTLYTPTFRKALLSEIERRKTLGPDFVGDSETPESAIPYHRKPKGGEIEPPAIEALLKLINSEHYQNLLSKSEGRRSKIWEKMFEEMQSQGFEIAGATKREKVARLFQKWRNMKRAFVKYQIAKFRGRDIKRPQFYELMFQIISKDVLNTCNSEYDSDEEEKMDDSDEDSESEYPTDLLELTQVDHDYVQPSGSGDSADVVASNMDTEHTTAVAVASDAAVKQSPPSQPQSRATRRPRSYQLLKQIKSLHETALAMQQQNFSKIISLLENQITEQNRLTTVISEYISSQSQRQKSKSKNGHRTESNGLNTSNRNRVNDFKDNDFLR